MTNQKSIDALLAETKASAFEYIAALAGYCQQEAENITQQAA